MNDVDYKAFVQDANDGRVLIGVDRPFARSVYTNMASIAIQQATGETPYIEKAIVLFAFIASPLAILGSAVLAGFAFRWWAALIVPAALLLWIHNRSRSMLSGSSLWFLTIVVIAAVIVHSMNLLPTPWMSGFLTAFIFAMWCDRLLYCTSAFFLRAFVLRNQRALEAFAEGITIRGTG